MNPSLCPSDGEIVGETKFFGILKLTSIGEIKLKSDKLYSALKNRPSIKLLNVKQFYFKQFNLT